MTKEELREDKVLTAVKEFKEYAQDNSQSLIILGVVLVAAIVGATMWKNSRAQSEQNAALASAQAQRLYYAGEFSGALSMFEEVESKYGSTHAAKSVALFLGNCQLSAGNPAAAEASFRKFLGKAGNNPIDSSAAHRGIGAALFDQGKAAEAGAEYKQAAQIEGNPLAVDDWMSAGLAFATAGQSSEAESAYGTVVDDFVGSARAQEARIRMKEVASGS